MRIIHRFLSFAILLSIVFAYSCKEDTCIHGAGPIVTQDIDIAAFHTFRSFGNFNIVLKEGDEISVQAETQENIIPFITTSVVDSVWDVNLQNGCYNDYQLTIYITHPSIKEFGILGSGNITILNRLDSIDNLYIYIGGSGNIQANDSLIISSNLYADISGSGNIILKGSVPNQNISIPGAGNYSAFDLLSEDCTITIPGSGNVMVNVSNTMDVFISGSGTVSYIGEPDITQTITGSGEIIDAN